MAKAFFLNIPAHGHMNPTLPLVRELVNRGETIIYYTGEEFREKVETAGAEFRTYESLGEAVRFQFVGYDERSPNMVLMARIMIQFAEDVLPPLLDVLRREQPDYILHDFTCIWGLLAAEILAIPAVAIIPQFPINYQTRPDPYPGMWRDFLWNFVAGIPHLGPFKRVARRISAAYETRPITLMNFMSNHEDLNIVFTSRYFQPNAEDFDESFVFVGPSIAPRDETIDFPLDFPAHCTGPLVYISLGTTIFTANVAFYRACFQAFGDTDKRVILSAGQWTDPESLADAPPNFIIRPYVPQLEILKLADVFITHGGMGSVSEGLLHSVPLIVIPQAADQPFVAQRVRRLGAGYVLYRQLARPAELDRLVDAIVADESVRAECNRIAESFKEAGGFVRAADVILDCLSAQARTAQT
ncbi:glycosyl transferase [Candidatus Bipolaricaulota bacterium]|nr:glycosyl transferase [Candidatus Bipolaricaulota bacterium]